MWVCKWERWCITKWSLQKSCPVSLGSLKSRYFVLGSFQQEAMDWSQDCCYCEIQAVLSVLHQHHQHLTLFSLQMFCCAIFSVWVTILFPASIRVFVDLPVTEASFWPLFFRSHKTVCKLHIFHPETHMGWLDEWVVSDWRRHRPGLLHECLGGKRVWNCRWSDWWWQTWLGSTNWRSKRTTKVSYLGLLDNQGGQGEKTFAFWRETCTKRSQWRKGTNCSVICAPPLALWAR